MVAKSLLVSGNAAGSLLYRRAYFRSWLRDTWCRFTGHVAIWCRVGDRSLKSDTRTRLPSIFIFLQVAFFSVLDRVYHACTKMCCLKFTYLTYFLCNCRCADVLATESLASFVKEQVRKQRRGVRIMGPSISIECSIVKWLVNHTQNKFQVTQHHVIYIVISCMILIMYM